MGWLLGIESFQSLVPSWATMKVNTALSFVLCGIALWFHNDDASDARHRWIGLTSVLPVLVVSAMTITWTSSPRTRKSITWHFTIR
jgi:uncharacterized membrane protein